MATLMAKSRKTQAMATSKATLKLLINKTESKVLFAEANKDFIDFLFYIFSLPVGAIVKLLKNKSMVGCLGDLYQSIETLNETYFQSNQNKNSVLNPKSPACPTEIPLLLPDNKPENRIRTSYTCPNRHLYVADVPNSSCHHCLMTMTQQLIHVSPEAATTAAVSQRGFVKDVVTYMVMDNLEVMPMSTISSITLINKFNVKDLGSLEEKVVDFGVDEGLKLLKATMECKNVLTSVFLGEMKA